MLVLMCLCCAVHEQHVALLLLSWSVYSGGPLRWSCRGWSITCRCTWVRSVVARHSGAAQQQQQEKWDGIAWHGPKPNNG